MRTDIDRPVARLRTSRGLAAYDPREVAAYRAALEISQEALAARMKVARPGVARYESDKYGPLEARYGDRLLAAIESEVLSRIKLGEEGRAALDAIRGGTGVTKVRRARP